MKIRYIIGGIFAILIIVLFIMFPDSMIMGATKGMLICSDVIIPSLFPFSAICIFMFNTNIIKMLERIINPLTKGIFKLTGQEFCIMLMSFLGGFPVGATLINKLVIQKAITKNKAEQMLCYCVNPGPAFVIIAIGQAVLGNKVLGIMIYLSNLLSAIFTCLLFSLTSKNSAKISYLMPKRTEMPISDMFVDSVASACSAVINICGFVILFSTVISLVLDLGSDVLIVKYLVSLLEISNGVSLVRNVYYLSFLSAFSGFCVHMQILTSCTAFKVNYLKFLIFRIFNGVCSCLITLIQIKISGISLPVMSTQNVYTLMPTGVSLPLCAAMIFMSITLLVSINEKYVEKARIL